jgi:hypothetical protein
MKAIMACYPNSQPHDPHIKEKDKRVGQTIGGIWTTGKGGLVRTVQVRHEGARLPVGDETPG